MLNKLYNKLLSFSEDNDVLYSFWGNDIMDSFHLNFDYDIHRHIFESAQNISDTAIVVFVILGPINEYQQAKLLQSLGGLNLEKRLVIKLRGSLTEESLKASYQKIDIDKLGPYIDIRINKFPFDLSEVIEAMGTGIRTKLKC